MTNQTNDNWDLIYICTTLSNLSGIPIRLYQNMEQVFYHANVWLPKDPIQPYLNDILQVQDHVGYFVTPTFHYYGIINYQSNKIILGPTKQTAESDQELRDLAFLIDVPTDEVLDFLTGMKTIIRMPFDSILQTMCTVNYSLNKEKLLLTDITLYDTVQSALNAELLASQMEADPTVDETNQFRQEIHNTLGIEQTIMNIVRHGDIDAFHDLLPKLPAVRGGIVAESQLRQAKNTFIVTATLASRAAIQGGMDVEESLSLSDAFIQKCERLYDLNRINNLTQHMLEYYTEHVGRLHITESSSRLTTEVANYVRQHLSEAITTEDIARHLYVSRPHLSTRFRAETGMTLTEFIAKEKAEEAKSLLRYTDKSLLAISAYLGYSSQSHFSRVFKKYAGHSPGEYREKYQG